MSEGERKLFPADPDMIKYIMEESAIPFILKLAIEKFYDLPEDVARNVWNGVMDTVFESFVEDSPIPQEEIKKIYDFMRTSDEHRRLSNAVGLLTHGAYHIFETLVKAADEAEEEDAIGIVKAFEDIALKTTNGNADDPN